MKAAARIVAEADGRGGTRLAVLRGESPLLLRRTGPRNGPGVVTVHLVGGAAGPLRGDDLRIDVEVGPGARLDVRSVAASLAMPGKPGAPQSRLETRASVAAGGVLRWMPEPVIAVTGCHHLAVTTVEVAEGGSLLWRDDLVCGRHGEAAGDVRTDVTIRYGGATLYRHELAIGPSAPGWSGPAVLGSSRPAGAGSSHPAGAGSSHPAGAGSSHPAGAGSSHPAGAGSSHPAGAGSSHPAGAGSSRPAGAGDGRAIGAMIFVGEDLPSARLLGGDAVLMPLAGPGMLATVIGSDIRQVRAALDPFCVDRHLVTHSVVPV